MGIIAPPEPLRAKHQTKDFHCGETALDVWLKRRALANQSSGASRTYVLAADNKVIAYYALAAGAVACAEATGRTRRNMPDPVPVMVLGRLAVDVAWQGRGIGRDLLRDAVVRTLRAAEIAGIRALVVHALNDAAARFYERSGFKPSTIRPRLYLLLLDDARRFFV